MSLDESTNKTERKKKSISDEILEQREKLRKLEEKQKEQIRKERERTSKAVFVDVCPSLLRDLDSNQEPIDYIDPKITSRDGLYHHRGD